MDLKCILVGSAGVIIGATVQYVISTHLWPNRHKTYTWIFALRNHKKFGEPTETDLVLDRDGYSVGYSLKYKAALWVSYIMSKGSVGINVERGDNFYADPDIPEQARVEPDNFRNTGYDKGHLAPSAAIDFSRRSNEQTFAMSNIVLQDPKLNRQAWGNLEGKIRKWTQSKGKMLVITGPIYNDNPEFINQMPVPENFYKVIYSFKDKKCIGFIFPNKPVKASQLWDNAMSVADVEEKTGYNFFSKKSNKIDKKHLDKSYWEKNNL